MEYYNRIKDLREEKELNQTQLGKIFNLNQKTISQYERKERQIPNELIIELAKFFNVTTDYLLGVSDKRKP